MGLLHTKRVGLVLRVFSPKPELIGRNAQQVWNVVSDAAELELGGHFVFSRIDVLVSADTRYGDTDCGGTADMIKELISLPAVDNGAEGRWTEITRVSTITHGDIFCGMLNYGIAHQLRDRIDYTMILSIGVKDYLTAENVEAMLSALEAGARVTGLAISELAPSILAGRVANTAAIWDNVSLMTAGGFDLRAAKPLKDDRLANYVRGWSAENGEVYYAASGVEEIIPLARLVKLFGACIAPIVPLTGARWTTPDDPDVQKRERAKLGTKFERQSIWAAAEGVDFSFLEGGVMPAYRGQK